MHRRGQHARGGRLGVRLDLEARAAPATASKRWRRCWRRWTSPAEALQADATKAALRANTDAAIAAGVYGVPTLAFEDGQLFWGNDAHDFALAALRDPAVLADADMQRVSQLPVGLQRRS